MGRNTFTFDWVIAIPAGILSLLGLSALASLSPSLVWFQGAFIILGIILFFVFSHIDVHIYEQMAPLLFVLSCIFLFIPLLFPDVRGSSRWIFLGPLQIQPSELIKPSLILFLAWFFKRFSISHPGKALFGGMLFFIPTFLVFRQPDLGNVLVYLFCFMAIILMAGLPRGTIFLVILFSVIFLPISTFFLHDYQKNRLVSFLSPSSDALGTGYNGLQALITTGSGQLFGRGFGRGVQSHLRFLPEYHTDFIFSSFVEEFGLVGGLFLLCVFFFLLWTLVNKAQHEKNMFRLLFIVGVCTQIFIQVFINAGMNMGIVPITGITLPLVSYGGSSCVATWITLGICSSIRKKRYESTLAIR